jgi:hypothetical protein
MSPLLALDVAARAIGRFLGGLSVQRDFGLKSCLAAFSFE